MGVRRKVRQESIHQQFGRFSWWLSHPLLNVWTNWIMFARLRGKHVASKVIPCISLPPRKNKHMLFPPHPPTTLSPPPKKNNTLQRFVCFFFFGSVFNDGEMSSFLPWQCVATEFSGESEVYSANFAMVS